MLLEEIDWFKDQIPTNLDGYLQIDRTGRVFPLNESMRRRVYAAMYDYQRELWRRNRLDWGDVPRELWLAERKGGVTLPQYDVVLIDEAQLFAPLWFDFVRRIVKPQVGQLFMVADPTQGFMKRRHSWQSHGLNVRGRTVRLAKSYRTTREIMDFATLLYRTRLPEKDDTIVEPDTSGMPSGAFPQIIQLTASQDELTRIIDEIRQLLKAGVPAKDMLVIHADSFYTSTHCDRFNADLPTVTAYDPRYDTVPKGLRIISLDAATGIESPIVFLIGVHQLYEREQSLRLSHSEREELIAENTRRLYMAITRAGRRLVLTYVGELPLFWLSIHFANSRIWLTPKDGSVASLYQAAQRFLQMVQQRQPHLLPIWIEDALNSSIDLLVTFAQGIQQDFPAVLSALSSPWSNGQVEGQVNRLKFIKR